jgi:colanic acid biosynthesis glycosyl transferase WcaI
MRRADDSRKPATGHRANAAPRPKERLALHYAVPVATGTQRPRLLVFNQYYHPGVEATAHLLTELCESLAPDYSVTVITGRLHGREDEPDYEVRNGVEIVRVHSTSYDRAALQRRIANYFTYSARALRRGLVARRPDVVLCMTDPPLVGNVAQLVALRFRRPFVVVSQDVFPEIAVSLGRLRHPLVVGVLRRLIGFYLRRADRVVAIGPVMKARLVDKGAHPDRVEVIPNWVDTSAVTPEPRDNPWARAHDLVDHFVVMHSGNVGHAQNLDVLIEAAAELDDLEQLRVLIIGTGARVSHVTDLAQHLAADRVQFLPYQPRSTLSESLSSADVHFLGLSPGLSGYIVPSRLYGILAAGRPVLAAVETDSEPGILVREAGCGIVVPPNRPDLIAQAIREFVSGEHDLAAMGRNGREYVEAHGSRESAVARYRQLLDGVRRS